jgi:thiosulfate/3-mercaptopyruvate sulfurtransferase
MRSFNRWFLFSIYLVLIAASSIVGSEGKAEKSNIPLLVETRWFAENSNSFILRIVDYGRTAKDYGAGHIPGATFVEKKTVWDEVDGIPGMVPGVKTVVETLEEASISNDNTVVIYDSAGGLWASRLFWAILKSGSMTDPGLSGEMTRMCL